LLKAILIPGTVIIAVMLFTLSAIGGPAGDTYADTDIDSEEQVFWDLLNDYRVQNGVPPLLLDPDMTNAAEWMSADMGEKNYFSHNDSLGRTPWERLCDFNYCHNTWKGENIAAGYTTGTAVFDAWRNSPGHNSNMLGEHYRVMGLARVYTNGSDFGWYWTNDFGGQIVEESPPPAPTISPSPTPEPTIEHPTPSPEPTPTVNHPTPTPSHSPTPTATPTPSPTLTPSPTPENASVDVNCDSYFTTLDSMLILQYLADVSHPSGPGCPDVGSSGGVIHPHGDVDCNDVVNTLDALLVLTYIAGYNTSVCDA
jgi:uncharacterized protein YkwD